MNNPSDQPRTSSIPSSYLKKKEANYKQPSPGIFTILLRNLSYCEHDELKVRFCEEILNRLEVWTALDPSVQEKIKAETVDFLNKSVLPTKTQAPDLKSIIEKILKLATQAEYELGIMVDVDIKDEKDEWKYGSLLQLLDYCRHRVNEITGSDSIFPESEIPTRPELNMG